MIYSIDDIRELHLEISSYCNAECPMCPRNLYGSNYNEGYVEHNMTLSEAKIIFAPEFISQLQRVLINGNFGDMVMNPETLDIIHYFKSHARSDLVIEISTNGGARNKEFWQQLAATGARVYFCLDGLEDTHSLYRRNTVYSTVIKNAEIFIKAGGYAVWKMIAFDHNEHQFEQAQNLSKQMGFKGFTQIRQNRNNSPVFDREGNFVYVIGQLTYTVPPQIKYAIQLREFGHYKTNINLRNRIDCEVKRTKSVYVNSIGEVYPCCYMGHNPLTFGKNSYLGAANQQVKPLISQNNALEHGLNAALKWFDKVAESWQWSTVEQGRLIHCNDKCGQD
jgi:MoaA/NifB/PqqE/SkfB family radical SAM enzyme